MWESIKSSDDVTCIERRKAIHYPRCPPKVLSSGHTSLETFDVRFHVAGSRRSDAMNPDPTTRRVRAHPHRRGDGLEGHGFAFTIGRGNEVQVAAIRALEPFLIGLPVEETLASMGTSGADGARPVALARS
jgi:hypothetical protein